MTIFKPCCAPLALPPSRPRPHLPIRHHKCRRAVVPVAAGHWSIVQVPEDKSLSFRRDLWDKRLGVLRVQQTLCFLQVRVHLRFDYLWRERIEPSQGTMACTMADLELWETGYGQLRLAAKGGRSSAKPSRVGKEVWRESPGLWRGSTG